MFTGLVRATGEVVELRGTEADHRLRIRCDGDWLSRVQIGDSIAVNGVCLTVALRSATSFVVDLSTETLSRTALAQVQVGGHLNLEPSLSVDDLLGGHLLSGHVDGVGELLEMSPVGRSQRCIIRAPQSLMRYIAEKGAIAVDGASLTVNALGADHFVVDIIPHTLQSTLFGSYRPGVRVNLEVDMIARHIERLLIASGRLPEPPPAS